MVFVYWQPLVILPLSYYLSWIIMTFFFPTVLYFLDISLVISCFYTFHLTNISQSWPLLQDMVRVSLRSMSKHLSWGTVSKFTITNWEGKLNYHVTSVVHIQMSKTSFCSLILLFPQWSAAFEFVLLSQVPDRYLIRKLSFHSFHMHVVKVYGRTEFNS